MTKINFVLNHTSDEQLLRTAFERKMTKGGRLSQELMEVVTGETHKSGPKRDSAYCLDI
jgi:hypothetical protein